MTQHRDMANSNESHVYKNWPPSIPVELVTVFDRFFEGVTITDAKGIILYVNNIQTTIDDLDPEDLLGRKVADVYRVDDGISPTMQCLRTEAPIINLACYYRTRLGKVVNSIHNIYPLFDHEQLVGAICFIRDYSIVEQTYQMVSVSQPDRKVRRVGKPSTRQSLRRLNNGTRFTIKDIIGDDPDFRAALEAAGLSAASRSPVMLMGETGTGKELFAQSIHNLSPRKRQAYVAVNCAAIPENLLEGILFGTSKGAFTGAVDKAGLFEIANGGTLLLDELNAMPVGLQAKLLRVLQEHKIRRVGSLQEIDIDVKIISSVNTEPHQAIEQGTLRPDLMYRLAVVFIRIPPLRERKRDLVKLTDHFIAKCNRSLGKKINKIEPAILKTFRNYHWPGNVRELEHVIEGAMNIVEDGKVMSHHHLSFHVHPLEFSLPDEPTGLDPDNNRIAASASFPRNPFQAAEPKVGKTQLRRSKNLNEIRRQKEIQLIKEALQEARGVAAQAARILGISPQLLHHKLKRYQIDRTQFKNE